MSLPLEFFCESGDQKTEKKSFFNMAAAAILNFC